MIKVLLVEDELLSRMSLRALIDWEQCGYHIVGECADGDQALPLIEKMHPHIVITDVKMERMQGPELVRLLSRRYPNICTIILSGYGDYSYVRDTLKLGAVDYLIKSELTPNSLLDALERARKRLAPVHPVEHTEGNLKALRQQFLLQLISGQYANDPAFVRQKMRHLHMRMDASLLLPVLLRYHAEQEEALHDVRHSVAISFSVCDVIEEILREYGGGAAVTIAPGQTLILLCFAEDAAEASSEETLRRLLPRVAFCLKKFLRLQSTFFVGRMARTEDIDESYAQLIQAQTQREQPAVAAILAEPIHAAPTITRDTTRAYSPAVRSALSIIQQKFRDPLTLTTLSEKLDMNSSYLSTLFKSETGIGFVEYINDVRLQHAKALMDQSDMKLKQILIESGFYSYQHFFAQFKKRFGMTPKEYMRGTQTPFV